MKPMFDINNYKEKTVMHCPTRDGARIFLDLLHSLGREWRSGRKYSEEDIRWEHAAERTCYNFIAGCRDSYSYYESNGYTILEFEDFCWEASESIENSEEIDNFLSLFCTKG